MLSTRAFSSSMASKPVVPASTPDSLPDSLSASDPSPPTSPDETTVHSPEETELPSTVGAPDDKTQSATSDDLTASVPFAQAETNVDKSSEPSEQNTEISNPPLEGEDLPSSKGDAPVDPVTSNIETGVDISSGKKPSEVSDDEGEFFDATSDSEEK